MYEAIFLFLELGMEVLKDTGDLRGTWVPDLDAVIIRMVIHILIKYHLPSPFNSHGL